MSARLRWTRCSITRWAASFLCLLALLGLGGAWAAPQASPKPATLEPLPRKVLVLFDSTGGREAEDSIVHRGFQMVFDYYGLVCVYRDIRTQPLPDDAFMAGCLGVVTTFRDNSVRDGRTYLNWLLRQIKAGRRVMVLNHLGVTPGDGYADADLYRLINAVWAEFGVAPVDLTGLDMRKFRHTAKQRGLVDFERSLPVLPEVTSLFIARSPTLKAYVMLTHPARAGVLFPAIFTSTAGGFAAENHIFWEETTGTGRRKWYLNPFAFAEGCLGLKGRIAPDVTTLNGTRIAFSHLDADGFAGTSRIDGKSLCAEVIRDRIAKRVDFPLTLSVIQADVDPSVAADPALAKRAQAVARELFRLPNVEPGSHTFSHPFYWNSQGSSKANYEERFPYVIKGYKFDEAREIDGSIRFVSSLSPADKPCRLLQWSGDCFPTARQLARVDALGLLNINGGDTMFDRLRNSLTGVASLAREVDGFRQIYTAAANENVMTGLWTGPFYGFINVIETFARTGEPRRLKPINVYYHFFSAERPDSLAAVERVYAWVLAQSPARLFTTEYVEMARDYSKVRISRLGPSAYVVEDYGKCVTLRLDADAPPPDMERCENVLGFSRQKQGLYVSLAPGAARAVLWLEQPSDRPAGKPAARSAARPYLAQATGFVTAFRPGNGAASLAYRGFGTGRVALAGFVPGASLRAHGSALAAPVALKAGPDGGVEISGVRTGQLEVGAP